MSRLASILQKQDEQNWQVRNGLQKLSISVELIWGKEVQVLPSSHAQDLPGSFVIHIIPNTGHMEYIEQSNLTNKLIGKNSAQA